MRDLVDSWAESLHEEEHIIVMYEAKNYPKTLKKLGISNTLKHLHESEIVISIFTEYEDALKIFKMLCNEQNPYSSLYSMGKFIADSIDEEISEILNNG